MKNLREILNKMAALDNGNMTEEQREQYNALVREYEMAKRENETEAMEQQARENNKPERKTVIAQIREAVKMQKRTITVDGYTPSSGSAVAGVHDHVVETKVEGILDPLYTNSVLSALGVRFYPGLPQGDIKIPVMGKNTVGWEAEIGAASETGNTFSSVTLSPKRLTAYVDISKKLLLQDTIGAEQAIMNDLVKAVGDKLEATVFGYAAGSSTQPAGMFNGQTLADAKTFAKVCEIEAGLEDACVNPANCKYLLSPKAKATLRTMATNGAGSPRVLAGNDIDGVPAVVSANVIDSVSTTKGAYIFGDFANLAVGSWGNVEIGIYEDSATAVNGTVRLVVNAYFDAKVLRAAAFAYGDVRHA